MTVLWEGGGGDHLPSAPFLLAARPLVLLKTGRLRMLRSHCFYLVYCFARAIVKNYQIGWVKQRGCFVLQFWRIEVQPLRLGWSFWGQQGKYLFSRLGDRHLPVSLYIVFLFVYMSKFPSFIRILVLLDLGLPWWPHFNLITSIKTLSSNKFTFWGTGD